MLRTTVIVGFPGETEAEFQEMLDLLEEIRFERVGAFPYSVEEGTPAAGMTPQVSDAEKRDRLETLMEAQREISREKNEALVGQGDVLLVDRALEGDPEFVAEDRTRGQAVEVDGVTRLVRPAGPGSHGAPGPLEGSFVHVRIEDAAEYDLRARVVG